MGHRKRCWLASATPRATGAQRRTNDGEERSWCEPSLNSLETYFRPGARIEDVDPTAARNFRPGLVGRHSDAGTAERLAKVVARRQRAYDVPAIDSHPKQHWDGFVDGQPAQPIVSHPPRAQRRDRQRHCLGKPSADFTQKRAI